MELCVAASRMLPVLLEKKVLSACLVELNIFMDGLWACPPPTSERCGGRRLQKLFDNLKSSFFEVYCALNINITAILISLGRLGAELLNKLKITHFDIVRQVHVAKL